MAFLLQIINIPIIGLLTTLLATLCCGLETPYISIQDKERLKNVFTVGLAGKELTSVHYSVLGYKLLNQKIPDSKEICKVLTDSLGKEGPDTFYYIASTWKEVGCPGTLPPSVSKYLTSVLQKDALSTSDIYHAIEGLRSSGQAITKDPKVEKAIQAALKKDDSVSSLGYTLHAASLPVIDGAFVFDRIEDIIFQADEIDGKYLQFEGGLSITALVISGAYKLSAKLNKTPAISPDQATKFSNYFVTRKSVQTPKGAWSLLNVLQTLTTNKFHRPIVVSVRNIDSIKGVMSIDVTDLLGKTPTGSPFPVTLESLARISDNTIVASKIKFEPLTEKSSYQLKFPSGTNPGVYKATINVTPSDQSLIGGTNNVIEIKITGQLAVTDPLLIAAVDSDHFLQPKYNKVMFPEKFAQVLEIDSQQHLALRFNLKEKSSGSPINVHQAFVRLSHSVTGQELIFVSEKDSNNGYKLDLDIGAKSAEFGSLPGIYNLEIIAGDSVLSNSLQWHVADIKLSFAGDAKQKPSQSMFSVKPEIKHLFREPEKRPPVFVSNLFTGLVFVPLIILFVLWFKLGINVSNFSLRLSTLGFHLGLGSIFALFVCFWLKLNMFETLKYLLVIGAITFLSANKLLSSIAAKHKP
ncbi:dolichyl-diphosphooligosaccharide--protein glycosyltransferase subunit 2 [Halyomorpha halys]|uniref:dolichyl-diphosphooligosaccharide--protein glycosyltransferase subunit 2 n=1 Tax=Halyomorpha halys TaxID=286706 RepID=UPI0006D4DA0F|nr:dolichyl-diphosphooligosaccharide--protein glycosyltransferase subunit 2 [Halyomorpha halys]